MLTGCASDRGQVRIMRHDQERGPVGIVNLPRKGARPTAAARHWRAWNWRRLDRGKVATIKDIAAPPRASPTRFVSRLLSSLIWGRRARNPVSATDHRHHGAASPPSGMRDLWAMGAAKQGKSNPK
jgi:hypothetical protein